MLILDVLNCFKYICTFNNVLDLCDLSNSIYGSISQNLSNNVDYDANIMPTIEREHTDHMCVFSF
jgi:hypothetical protein